MPCLPLNLSPGAPSLAPAGLALPVDPDTEMADAPAAAGAEGGRLAFSSACGRVHMMNVTVQNVGVDWHHPGNCYWRHQIQRHESCRVILHGRSEFEAYDCRISGDQVGPAHAARTRRAAPPHTMSRARPPTGPAAAGRPAPLLAASNPTHPRPASPTHTDARKPPPRPPSKGV